MNVSHKTSFVLLRERLVLRFVAIRSSATVLSFAGTGSSLWTVDRGPWTVDRGPHPVGPK